MPKPNTSPPNSAQFKSTSDDAATPPRGSDVALRKKKNADAQAAFRARRANYIATLEETVTSLESVVLQLQDSCRETQAECSELRQENGRLRHEARERDKFWKALWQAKRTGQPPDAHCDDLLRLSSNYSTGYPHPNAVEHHMSSSHMNQYGQEGLRYPDGVPSTSLSGDPYQAQTYADHSNALAFGDSDHVVNDCRSQHLDPNRIPKYGQYPSYGMHGNDRNDSWPQAVSQTSSSGGESGPQDSGSSSHSPGFAESPHITSSGLSYVPRFPVVEDQKVPLTSLDAAPYMFSASPTHSPTASTPPSASSVSLTPFNFTFPDGSVTQDRSDFDYRRQQSGHGPEVTLHGGTADISMSAPNNNGVRYRLSSRRANSGPERLVAPIPQLPGNSNDPRHERGSSEGDSETYARLRSRRSGTLSRNSRSPSPGGTPPISGTLAVIKAQAFGALRRTRTRSKKTTETAAKVAMVLEARGIGMGLNVGTGSKRPRLHDDNDTTY